jgi:hypothetical protein
VTAPIDTEKAYDLDRLKPPTQRQKQAERIAAQANADAALSADRARQEALVTEALAARREESDKQSVRRWDRSMRRTFKGILPRPVRLSFLEAEKQRLERKAEREAS